MGVRSIVKKEKRKKKRRLLNNKNFVHTGEPST